MYKMWRSDQRRGEILSKVRYAPKGNAVGEKVCIRTAENTAGILEYAAENETAGEC